MLTDADIRRIVFDGAGQPIEVGHRQRLFRGAMRDAIEIRDRTCTHPGCDQPANRSDIHHIEPWPDGPTNPTNAETLCRYHHRWRHRQQRRGTDPP